MKIQAINPKHQRALEALYKADRAHSALIDKHNAALDKLDPFDSERYQRTHERLADKEGADFDAKRERYVERSELPERELEAFTRAYFAHHEYTPYLLS